MTDRKRREREMGYTRAEFVRLVPTVAGDDWERDGDQIKIKWGGGKVLVTLGPDGFRQIAMMRLPRMHVAFDYEGLDDAEIGAFEHRFERSYQKGGG